jgi:hypothetical protein
MSVARGSETDHAKSCLEHETGVSQGKRPLWLFALGVAVLGILLQSCATPSRLDAPPADVTLQAVALNEPTARFWPSTGAQEFFEEVLGSVQREMADRQISDINNLPPAYFLAVSGGGDEGAFGAGFLVGWSETGTRPEFKLVTGVSTGALIAPFAFLGEDYDDVLREVYTTISADDVFAERGLISAIFDDALTDSAPLFDLISKHVTEEFVSAIAHEHARGRILLIGTTNIDVREPVIWNIGAMAASGHPGTADLIRKILLASAAVPAVFPPVMIDVEVDGTPYQEMHVDGGAIAQLFLYPESVGRRITSGEGLQRERISFIIRNGRLGNDWEQVDRLTLDIAGRAISTMIYVSGVNDLFRNYFFTQRDGVDYNLAYIENDFEAPTRDGDFDPVFMNALFEYGYQKGRSGYEWKKTPPYLTTQ